MKRIFFLILLFFVSQAMSSVFSLEERQQLVQYFFSNIQSNGAIIASPSRQNPNYYYDWIRDSALAMNLIETWYESTHASEYKERLFHYVDWTQKIQHQNDPNPGQDILGEPKFYINGLPFDEAWGRPQNDGPAIRASVLIHFANQLLEEHDTDYVTSHLYRNTLDPTTMGAIKIDLEYIAHHWQDPNYDLWEEIYGSHFFTATVQQKALREGATLARRLHDQEAALYYDYQALQINTRLLQHLDQRHQTIQATLAPHPGPQKAFELDSAVILGVLANSQNNGTFAPHSVYVQNTVQALHEQFNSMFPINNNEPGAILFGRYPGDTYDGYQTNSVGNPWFILTATLAEYYYTLADHVPLSKTNHDQIMQYIQIGDQYLMLIKKYAPDMKLSEQINLNTGIQQGAPSLTWSYVATLKALDYRDKLIKKMAR